MFMNNVRGNGNFLSTHMEFTLAACIQTDDVTVNQSG